MEQKRAPWYRERLVWLLIAFPAAAILGGIATLVIATRTSDGLVADDYYKQGMAINQVIARDQQARRLGLVAVVRLAEGTAHVELESSAVGAGDLRMTLIHPIRSGADRAIRLERHGAEYVGIFAPLSPGKWEILLEDEARSWRLSGEVKVPEDTTVRMSSGTPTGSR